MTTRTRTAETDPAEISTITLQLQELKALFEVQARELTALRQQQPKIVRRPSHVRRAERSYTPPEALQRQAMKGLAQGESAMGNQRWYDSPRGRSTLPEEYRPIFQPGDIVRLNPDVV